MAFHGLPLPTMNDTKLRLISCALRSIEAKVPTMANKKGLQPTMTVDRRPFLLRKSGRGERIRTSDPSVPNRVLYQAEPRPDGTFILSRRRV